MNCYHCSLDWKLTQALRVNELTLTWNPCDFVMCQPKDQKRQTPLPFPPPTTYLWTGSFLSQECSLSLFPDGIQYNQSECVFVKLPTATLLSPIRPVKSRVWQRRRGPICFPCYITLSGWRSWGEMPFTKNSFLKTSTRFRDVETMWPIDLVWPQRVICTMSFSFRLLVSCPG